jgi:hypothetical protein
LIPICISLFDFRRNDILPEAYAMAVAARVISTAWMMT